MPPNDRYDLSQYIKYDGSRNVSEDPANSLYNRAFESGKTLAREHAPLLVIAATAGLAAYAWSRPAKPVVEGVRRAAGSLGARSSSTVEANSLTVMQTTQQVEAHAAHAASHHVSHDVGAIVSHDAPSISSIAIE